MIRTKKERTGGEYLPSLIVLTSLLLFALALSAGYYYYADYHYKADKRAVFEIAARLIESGRRQELIDELERMSEQRFPNEREYRQALEALEKRGAK